MVAAFGLDSGLLIWSVNRQSHRWYRELLYVLWAMNALDKAAFTHVKGLLATTQAYLELPHSCCTNEIGPTSIDFMSNHLSLNMHAKIQY